MKTEEMPAEPMTVAEMFVRALEHEGVEYVFGIPEGGEPGFDERSPPIQADSGDFGPPRAGRCLLWRMCTDV